MSERLSPYIDRCIFSFIEMYKKLKINMPEIMSNIINLCVKIQPNHIKNANLKRLPFFYTDILVQRAIGFVLVIFTET